MSTHAHAFSASSFLDAPSAYHVDDLVLPSTSSPAPRDDDPGSPRATAAKCGRSVRFQIDTHPARARGLRHPDADSSGQQSSASHPPRSHYRGVSQIWDFAFPVSPRDRGAVMHERAGAPADESTRWRQASVLETGGGRGINGSARQTRRVLLACAAVILLSGSALAAMVSRGSTHAP